MHRVVFLDNATIGDGVNIPSSSFAHQWTNFDKKNATQTLRRAKNAELIITNKVACVAKAFGMRWYRRCATRTTS